MIFKRKKQRELNTGDICVLNKDFVDELRNSKEYLENSCSNKALVKNTVIYSHEFTSSNKKILFADVELFIVKKKHIFDGIFELIPINYHRDNTVGYVTRYILDKKITMFCSDKNLSLSGKNIIDVLLSSRYSSFESYISRKLLENHNVSFNWMR